MSDYRAVAAVTATLQNLISSAIRDAVPGATVQTGPPEDLPADQVAEGLVKVFLYRVEPNPTWRNAELPVRGSDGTLLRKPQLAVNLDYLMTFYGDERRKVPYLLLGLTMTALHAEPYPGLRHMPRARGGDGAGETEADPVSAALAGSGLEHQRHPVSFSLMPLAHDELIPLFSQLPYVMSVAYRASVLLLEPLLVPEPPLPVRRADLYVTTLRRPLLASVAPQLLPYEAAARVTLSGKALAAPGVKVLFGELASLPATVEEERLEVALPEGIQAGTHLVRVVHTLEVATGGPRRDFVESNPVALVLEPVVLDAAVVSDGNGAPAPPAAGGAAGGEGGDEGEDAPPGRPPVPLRLRFAPPVTATTPAVVLLNELLPEGEETSGEAGRRPRAYAFQTRLEPTAPDRVVVAAAVEPGTYLVRLQMGGVTSRLSAEPATGRFTAPRVTVS